jgi:hypothetical protein
MFDDKLAETIEEVYKKRPWLKQKIESNKVLFDAINELKTKNNYANIMSRIDLHDLQDATINKIIRFYIENRLQLLDLDKGD